MVAIVLLLDLQKIKGNVYLYLVLSSFIALAVVAFSRKTSMGATGHLLNYCISCLMIVLAFITRSKEEQPSFSRRTLECMLFAEAFLDSFRLDHVSLKLAIALARGWTFDFDRPREFAVFLLISLGTVVVRLPFVLICKAAGSKPMQPISEMDNVITSAHGIKKEDPSDELDWKSSNEHITNQIQMLNSPTFNLASKKAILLREEMKNLSNKQRAKLKLQPQIEDNIFNFASAENIIILGESSLQLIGLFVCRERHRTLRMNLRNVVDLGNEASAQKADGSEGRQKTIDCYLTDSQHTYLIDSHTALNIVAFRKAFKYLATFGSQRQPMGEETAKYMDEIINLFEESGLICLRKINENISSKGFKWLLTHINSAHMTMADCEPFDIQVDAAVCLNLRKLLRMFQQYHQVLKQLSQVDDFELPGCIGLKFRYGDKCYVKLSLVTSFESSVFHIDCGMTTEISLSHHLASKSRYFSLLVNSLSHEIKTPIAKILMMLENTMEKGFQGSISEGTQSPVLPIDTLKRIKQISTNLLFFTNGILDFGKVLNKKIDLNLKSFHLASVIRGILGNFDYAISDKKLVCSVQCQEDLEVKTDKHLVQEILYILIDNSIKFSGQNGTLLVDVQLSFDMREATFRVVDSGAGCSKAEVDIVRRMIEDPFNETLRTKSTAGIGMGIRTAQALVLALTENRGKLLFSSQKSEGAAAEFTVPLEAMIVSYTDNQGAQFKLANQTVESMMRDPSSKTSLPKKRGESDFQEFERKNSVFSRKNIHPATSVNHSAINSMQHISRGSPKQNKAFFMAIEQMTQSIIKQKQSTDIPNEEKKKLITEIANSARNSAKTPLYNMIGTVQIAEILVVDDDPMITQLLKSRLSDFGIYIREANSGEAAIQLIHKLMEEDIRLSLVITDYNMGEMNGADLTRRLRTEEFAEVMAGVPIVMLTSQDEKTTKDDCIKAGVDEFLSKPVQKDQLDELLRKYGIMALEK